MRILSALLLPLILSSLPLRAADYTVRDFGATGDGHTLDTAAINAAIEAASAAGGGFVHFSAGTYLSFSIHLRSHVTLVLAPGSVLVAAEPAPDLRFGFDPPEPTPEIEAFQDFGHSHWQNSFIWGENLEEIGITGPGTIYGRGLSSGAPHRRRDLLPEERRAGTSPDLAFPASVQEALAARKPGPYGFPGDDTLPAGVGNKAIALKNCRNVIFRDFTIYHGGHFGILATGVDNWTCDNLKIDTNRDGVDFDCCQNVRVANCTVNSPNDDAICPKSSFALGYNRITENVTITNCQVSGYDEGTLLDGTRTRKNAQVYGGTPTGRIKCGTESNGGFRNITISNCVFEACRGLALESVDGALMEDITVTNLTMRDVGTAPIFIRLGARLRGPEGTKIGTARRIKIDNVVAHNVSAQTGILLAGLPGHPIEDVTISNLFADYAGGVSREAATRVVPEYATDYPDPLKFGRMPAWGLWARHVRNLVVHHVEFRTEQPDFRPALVLEDAADTLLERVKLPVAEPGWNAWVRQSPRFVLSACPGLPNRDGSAPTADERW